MAFENLSRSLLNPGPGQANLEAQPGLAPPPLGSPWGTWPLLLCPTWQASAEGRGGCKGAVRRDSGKYTHLFPEDGDHGRAGPGLQGSPFTQQMTQAWPPWAPQGTLCFLLKPPCPASPDPPLQKVCAEGTHEGKRAGG